MKRLMTFIDKLIMCKYYLFKHGNGLVEMCPCCNNTRLHKENVSEFNNTYTATYICDICGASCEVTEEWKRNI